MNLNESNLDSFRIKDLGNTLPEIKTLVETYYDLGSVTALQKLEIGETNFNYYITLKKDSQEIKYFAQLFSSAKSLKHLKYELELRKHFMKSDRKLIKCALYHPTKDNGIAVRCYCIPTKQTRYFCIFDFLEGKTYDYDEWAFGKMTKAMLHGMAKGIASYHITANGYNPPGDCKDIMISYAEELAEYRRVFTEEFEKRKTPVGENAYYDRFGEYRPRLLELLQKYTDRYIKEQNNLPHCICHIDSGANNYIFKENFQPIAVCDMDWSHRMPRLFDLCWLIGEGFFRYDSEKVAADMNVDNIVELVDAYDRVMEENKCDTPGKLTEIEREMLPEMFQLVAIRLGLYNIWTYIITDNPTNTVEYNLYWGNCSISEMEFVERHMEEIKAKLRKQKEENK